MRRSSSGFTLVEIGIVVPILLLTAFFLFDVIFAMINSSTTERVRYNLTFDKQNALSIIENDSVLTSSFLSTTDTNIGELYPTANYTGTWSYRGSSSTSRVLILRNYSTTTNPLSTTRQPVFINDDEPTGAACTTTNIYFNPVLQYNIIYYVKNSNLYRRIATNRSTTLCVSQSQKQSCPTQAALTAAGLGARSSSCEADDELIASDVSNFTITYYDDKSATSLDAYTTGNDSLVATAVDAEVTLTLSRQIAGNTIDSTSTLRMSKINSIKKSSE